jgi:hypothetical protein
LYLRENLVSKGNRIDLFTSIANHSLHEIKVNKKRKSSTQPASNVRPPKRVLISNLSPTVLKETFGAHLSSNMLLKGEKFSNKNNFTSTATWKAPKNKELNILFCPDPHFFSHFTKDAIVLDPNLSDLKYPNEVKIELNDDLSLLSPAPMDTVRLDDESSKESDTMVDSGSVRDEGDSTHDEDQSENESDLSTQRIGHITGHANNEQIADGPVTETVGVLNHQAIQTDTPHQLASAASEPPPGSLLERWINQQNDTTIIPEIPPDPLIESDLGLLRIQHTFGLSLAAVKAVKRWAHESTLNRSMIFISKPNTRAKQLKLIQRAMGIKHDDSFQEIAIDWLPEKKKRPIHVRTFRDCLYELLSNEELVGPNGENISLPHPTDPYRSKPDVVPEFASEMHHGWWWMQTQSELCRRQNNEILVPIIGYMDGVSTDTNDRLPVTPLNITLGIFNTETRRKPEAWTTILLYPDDRSEASVQKGTKPIHKIQNLHNSVAVAFRELKEIMDEGISIPWKLKYGPEGKEHYVNQKFAFAYIIGDTEMHDKLCGRYGPRTRGIKSICRHCECPTDLLCEGGEQFEEYQLYTPQDLDPGHNASYFKALSHHPIKNAFHDLHFGANRNNIHLASPGELLHMVQKGACIRVVEGFVQMWTDLSVEQDDVTAVSNNYKCNILLEQMDHLGKVYGGYLSRQSDRDRPRTKFRSSLFSQNKVSTHLFLHSGAPILLSAPNYFFKYRKAVMSTQVSCTIFSARSFQIAEGKYAMREVSTRDGWRTMFICSSYYCSSNSS